MCLIVRQIPDMNPTPLVSSSRKLHSNCLNHNVIATALNIMAHLPNLCSPNGTVTIIFTISILSDFLSIFIIFLIFNSVLFYYLHFDEKKNTYFIIFYLFDF